MEQKRVVRFVTLKRLNLEDIYAELLSVYEPNALALPTVRKWH
jgi:hypothetical protein